MGDKILLVTGKLAEGLVRKYAGESKLETEVKVLPVSVAQFMSSRLLISELKKVDLSGFSMVLVPGSVRFDLKEAEDELGVPVFKGSISAADIPLVLDNLERVKLSKERPACELLKAEAKARAEEQLREAEEGARPMLAKARNFLVGKGKSAVPAGVDFPPRIVAEITDAPLRSDEEIVEIAERYVQEGAEIIDIGMIVEKEMADEIPRLISVLRENFDIPLSVDTLSRAEIERAIDCGIDLIVSISGSTIEHFQGLDVPAVIVPVGSGCDYPRDPRERLERLRGLFGRAKELGYGRAIADPILEPVNQGFTGSLMAFYELRKSDPEIPIFMGIGNVVELYDADSVGITALLLGAASEIGASFVLTAAASDKTFGNVREARRARDMMTLAKLRDSVPKDLGLDLLILKDKRRYFDHYDEGIEKGVEVIRAAPKGEFIYDSKGFWNIFVHKSEIVAVLCTGKGPQIVIKGRSAEEICYEIIERGLASELTHAAYLGRELQKAELALRTGKGYQQDGKFF